MTPSEVRPDAGLVLGLDRDLESGFVVGVVIREDDRRPFCGDLYRNDHAFDPISSGLSGPGLGHPIRWIKR
jgi:hypothetical protein